MPAKRHPQDASLSLISTFSVADMELLRSCEVLRQKLLPLLDDLTSCDFEVCRRESSLRGDPCYLEEYRNYTGPRFIQIKLARTLRAGIRKLVLAGRPPRIPDPSCFENLQEIYLHLVAPLMVRGPGIWEDDEKLLSACRANIDENLTIEERDASGLDDSLGLPRPHGGWALQIAEKLETQGSSAQVRVVLAQTVFTSFINLAPGFEPVLGRVEYGFRTGMVTRKPFGSGRDSRSTTEDSSEDNGEDNGEDSGEDASKDDGVADSGSDGEEENCVDK